MLYFFILFFFRRLFGYPNIYYKAIMKKHRYGSSVSVLILSQRNTRTAKPVPK